MGNAAYKPRGGFVVSLDENPAKHGNRAHFPVAGKVRTCANCAHFSRNEPPLYAESMNTGLCLKACEFRGQAAAPLVADRWRRDRHRKIRALDPACKYFESCEVKE